MVAVLIEITHKAIPALAAACLLTACGAAQEADADPLAGMQAGESGLIAALDPPLTLALVPNSTGGQAQSSADARPGAANGSITPDESGASADGTGIPAARLEVRLAEIDAPDAALAAAVLDRLAVGRGARLLYGGAMRDRYERALAHVLVEDEAGEAVWLQAELVRAGAARVMPFPDNHAAAAHLLALEAEARAASVGVWAEADHAVRDVHPDGLAQHYASVQLVEGRVIRSAETRSGRTYLNFGADYRTDFTVLIEPEDRPAFEGMDLVGLEGRRLRVRGWLREENGPMIRLEHPSRMEVLDEEG